MTYSGRCRNYCNQFIFCAYVSEMGCRRMQIALTGLTHSCVSFDNLVSCDTLQSWCCFCGCIEKDNVDILGIKY